MLDIFEKKNNTVAFVLTSIAAILWGALGLVSAQVQTAQAPPLLFLTMGTLFGLITAILIGLFSKNNNFSVLKLIFGRNSNKTALEKSNISDFRKTAILRSLSRGLSFVAIIWGFYLLDNKIIGVLLAETASIFSVLISYFLRKDLTKGGITYSWLLIGLSFCGLLFLLIKDFYLLGSGYGQLAGVFLSLCGALLGSYAVVLSPLMTVQLSEIQNKGNIRNSLNGQLIVHLLMFCILLVLSIVFYSIEDFIKLLDFQILLTGFLFGVSISFLVSFISMIGGAIATTHNIYIAWLLAPVTGIVLLWLFGYGEINSTIALAFILILVPNILLNLDIEESFSFKVSFIWILVSAITLFYYQGKPIDSETYFNSANALLVFFALMVGYLISKLNERSDFREQLFMRFLHKIRADGVDEKLVESISAKFQQANNRLTETVKIELQKSSVNITKYSELLDFKFIQNRRLYNIGELFVLLLISLLLIGITTLYRDHNFLYDSYAFIISIAVVFTLAQVVEKMFFSEYTQKSSNNIFMGNVIGTVFLAILTLAIIVLFLSKHNFVL